MKYALLFIVVGLFMIQVTSFAQIFRQVPAKRNISIEFHNKVDKADLQLDSTYTDPFGESFTIKQFKYYISNIILEDDIAKKTESFGDEYFLVDEADPATKIISLQTSLTNISSIQFLLGVDSIKNASGVQTGNLDPTKGMFWTWNTGYVMAKLEGNSPAANTPAHQFSWHVGGYKKGEATARKIILNLSATKISASGVIINANVFKWFSGVQDIRIADHPFCHEPGALAVSIADNYSIMFTIAAANE